VRENIHDNATSNIVGIGVGYSAGGPLNIGFPNELLDALGLAGLIFAAAQVILKTKTDSQADPKELSDAQGQLGLKDHQVDAIGKVFLKTQRQDASWKDLFGDEVGNAALLLDVARPVPVPSPPPVPVENLIQNCCSTAKSAARPPCVP
jgi:hypothetical protein